MLVKWNGVETPVLKLISRFNIFFTKNDENSLITLVIPEFMYVLVKSHYPKTIKFGFDLTLQEAASSPGPSFERIVRMSMLNAIKCVLFSKSTATWGDLFGGLFKNTFFGTFETSLEKDKPYVMCPGFNVNQIKVPSHKTHNHPHTYSVPCDEKGFKHISSLLKENTFGVPHECNYGHDMLFRLKNVGSVQHYFGAQLRNLKNKITWDTKKKEFEKVKRVLPSRDVMYCFAMICLHLNDDLVQNMSGSSKVLTGGVWKKDLTERRGKPKVDDIHIPKNMELVIINNSGLCQLLNPKVVDILERSHFAQVKSDLITQETCQILVDSLLDTSDLIDDNFDQDDTTVDQLEVILLEESNKRSNLGFAGIKKTETYYDAVLNNYLSSRSLVSYVDGNYVVGDCLYYCFGAHVSDSVVDIKKNMLSGFQTLVTNNINTRVEYPDGNCATIVNTAREIAESWFRAATRIDEYGKHNNMDAQRAVFKLKETSQSTNIPLADHEVFVKYMSEEKIYAENDLIFGFCQHYKKKVELISSQNSAIIREVYSLEDSQDSDIILICANNHYRTAINPVVRGIVALDNKIEDVKVLIQNKNRDFSNKQLVQELRTQNALLKQQLQNNVSQSGAGGQQQTPEQKKAYEEIGFLRVTVTDAEGDQVPLMDCYSFDNLLREVGQAVGFEVVKLKYDGGVIKNENGFKALVKRMNGNNLNIVAEGAIMKE